MTAVQNLTQAGRRIFPGAATPNRAVKKKILVLFGTRPEVIKLAPVIHELQKWPDSFQVINVASGQHSDLLYPFVEMFGIRVDDDLRIMQSAQTPSQVCARVLMLVDALLEQHQPDMILVQGDTSTTLGGALAGFYRGIPVGHVEAGLRSGNINNPYPEEMNRRLVSQVATLHFAATQGNQATLLGEGVPADSIVVTGNPVVDALHTILKRGLSAHAEQLLNTTAGKKRLVVTLHRRESFGERIADNLRSLRRFAEAHEDIAVIFPVHPNPEVRTVAEEVLRDCNRVFLVAPLNYQDFISVMSNSWLIVSDSGGIQEEAPSLGIPLLIVRDNTERTEVLRTGLARLVPGGAERLSAALEETYRNGANGNRGRQVENPFGNGDSGVRIVRAIAKSLGVALKNTVAAGKSE